MAAELDDAFERAQRYYSPWRIRSLLPNLLQFADGGRKDEPDGELAKLRVKTNKPHWWGAENALILHADLTRALDLLPWFTRQIVYRRYVLNEPASQLATVLRCDRETVHRHCEDGVDYMAWCLGYREKEERAERRKPSPRIWRAG